MTTQAPCGPRISDRTRYVHNRTMRVHSILLLLASLAAAVPASAKKARPQLCADARWVITAGGDLIATGSGPTVVVLMGGHLTFDGACGPEKVTAKASKHGMQVAAKWKSCREARKIVLAARAAPDCSGISGSIKAKKHKKTNFAAGKSVCGDTIADAGSGEQCDGAACVSGQPCTGSCTCNQNAAVTGAVRDVNGVLAGVTVADASGSPTGTTDATGHVTLTLTTGVPHTLKLSKSGYADRFVVVNLPATTPIGYFEAGMIARGATQSLPASGGSLIGADGSTITIPAGAVVDGSGMPVTGMIDVTLTPVNVVGQDLAAFPGRFEGVQTSGTKSLIASHGVVEYTLSQGGQPLQLAAGQQATIEIPIYAGTHLDGNDVMPGDHIPLWALDEQTGIWMQNGEGTVVSSPDSPSGVALEANVPHLSWWNSDIFIDDPFRPKPRCYRLNGTDYLPEPCALGPLPYGSHYDNSALHYRPRAQRVIPPGLRYPPRFVAEVNIPAEGGVETPVPAGVDTVLHACSFDGTQCGTVTVNGASGATADVRINLMPIDTGGGGETITVGWNQTYAIDPAGEVDHYAFAAQPGTVYGVSVTRSQGSALEGVVSLSSGGVPLDSSQFAYAATGFIVDPPGGGTIDITVDGTLNEPGGYTLRLDQLPAPTVDTLTTSTFPMLTVLSNTVGFTRYPIAGDAGALYTVSVEPMYSGAEIAGEARATSSSGAVLNHARLGKGEDTRLLFTMPNDGQADVDVFPRSLVTGAFGAQIYFLHMEKVTSIGDTLTTVPFHQQSTFSVNNTVRRFRFPGSAGSFIRTIVAPGVGIGHLLFSRGNDVIGTVRLGYATFPFNYMTSFLDADGEYAMDLVCNGGCTGMTPFDVRVATPLALSVNGSAHATIAQPQDPVTFVFDVHVPGAYAIMILDDPGLSSGTDGLLYGPNGLQVSNSLVWDGASTNNNLPFQGRYSLDVKNTGGGTGGFTVGVATIQTPVAVAFSGATASQSGQITVPGQLFYYTVDLTAGDHPHLTIDTPRADPMVANSGLRARIRLLGPNNPPYGGNIITTAQTGGVADETHAENLGMPTAVTGTYVVEVSTAATGMSQTTGAFTWSVVKQ